jgi:Predicted membrane protein
MSVITTILGALVAIEFFYITYLETVKTTSDATGRVFKMASEDLQNKNVQVLFKNQGIYNGLIGIGILYALFVSTARIELLSVFLVYIFLVALYGSLTSDRFIIFKQGGLAILTLLSIIFL